MVWELRKTLGDTSSYSDRRDFDNSFPEIKSKEKPGYRDINHKINKYMYNNRKKDLIFEEPLLGNIPEGRGTCPVM